MVRKSLANKATERRASPKATGCHKMQATATTVKTEKAISVTQLEAGNIPFSFIYNKPSRPWRRSMALFVQYYPFAYININL